MPVDVLLLIVVSSAITCAMVVLFAFLLRSLLLRPNGNGNGYVRFSERMGVELDECQRRLDLALATNQSLTERVSELSRCPVEVEHLRAELRRCQAECDEWQDKYGDQLHLIRTYEKANAIHEARAALTEDRERHLLRLQAQNDEWESEVEQLKDQVRDLRCHHAHHIEALQQKHQHHIAQLEQAGVMTSLRVADLEQQVERLRKPGLEQKHTLEDQIRATYGLIERYDGMLALESDPVDSARYTKSRQAQRDILVEQGGKYLRLCQTFDFSVPDDLLQILVLHNIPQADTMIDT